MDSFVFADDANEQDRRECLKTIQSYRDKTLGIQKGTEVYNETSAGYDKVMSTAKYKGPEELVRVMEDLFPNNRDQVKVLDAASGTGLCGVAMFQAGFTNLDAVDASAGMLAEAKKKNVYQRLICEYLGENKLGIKDRIYDAVTMSGETTSGELGENLVPSSAFQELASIIKPGGVLVNVTRKENSGNVPDEEGKWKLESKKTIPAYLFDKEGVVLTYRIV
ncbi:methyltransferase-like protein 27 isoform X1 [Gigantopelta aegis]|uniref:methyltransferase-like protein 27 isoform X1 n=1 Tax=Gigantopelta aegis TaxID=1735272 RepID=UPI001B88A4E6|nr:methyltransferase-like protein 27 isoform X1 [Gigantopelta aegis]XP_041363912.1 methyltransferase-like protein 27 isoform X2 [Gigantopelta aegis]XP_041363913.1 methyltransferase-like protein 27 isoform X1 [Gigantopelta aegis]